MSEARPMVMRDDYGDIAKDEIIIMLLVVGFISR